MDQNRKTSHLNIPNYRMKLVATTFIFTFFFFNFARGFYTPVCFLLHILLVEVKLLIQEKSLLFFGCAITRHTGGKLCCMILIIFPTIP